MSRHAAAEGGFTLLELLIAMSITVIGLLGLLSLHATTLRGSQVSSQLSEAETFGRELLEDMRAMSVEQIEARYGVLPVTVDDAVIGRANQSYARSISVAPTAISPDLVRMRVVVTWTEAGAAPGSENGMYDHSLALELIRTRQEIF